MRSFLRRLRIFLRETRWELKMALGLATTDHKELLFRIVRLPEDIRLQNTFAFSWGTVEFTKSGALRSQFEEIYLKRHYACSLPATQPVIVDCGGNIGLSAIWFRQNHPGCSLTVYEADADLVAVIKRNLARVGQTDVNVCNAAVWTEDTELTFAAKGDDTGHVDPLGNRRVQAINLAAALPERVDLLKMDIEGAEFTVLEHLLQTKAIARIRHLAVEFHPKRKEMSRMMHILLKLEEAGMRTNFEACIAPWTGLEDETSTFELVARNRTFLYLYAWRP